MNGPIAIIWLIAYAYDVITLLRSIPACAGEPQATQPAKQAIVLQLTSGLSAKKLKFFATFSGGT